MKAKEDMNNWEKLKKKMIEDLMLKVKDDDYDY
jgi:hypothetical protein